MVLTLTLSGGRDLAYDISGDPEGVPVILNHGFRVSRRFRHPDDGLAVSVGIRLIAVDLPGCGDSSPHPGRKVAGWGADVEQLADHIGLAEFAVAGHSAGGPHALAIAARLPDRVTHGALAAPAGPLDDDLFAAMLEKDDIKALISMQQTPEALRDVLASDVENANRDIVGLVQAMADDDPTVAALLQSEPAQRAMLEDAYATGASQTEEGRFETWMALSDWGFALDDVPQHFDIFYGDADDAIPPAMPLAIAERLPRASAHLWPGAGHLAMVERLRWTEFLTALARPR